MEKKKIGLSSIFDIANLQEIYTSADEESFYVGIPIVSKQGWGCYISLNEIGFINSLMLIKDSSITSVVHESAYLDLIRFCANEKEKLSSHFSELDKAIYKIWKEKDFTISPKVGSVIGLEVDSEEENFFGQVTNSTIDQIKLREFDYYDTCLTKEEVCFDLADLVYIEMVSTRSLSVEKFLNTVRTSKQ